MPKLYICSSPIPTPKPPNSTPNQPPPSVLTNPMPRIEAANALSLPAFKQAYLPNSIAHSTFTNPKTGTTYTVSLQTSSSISPADLESCFRLVETTSAPAYAVSSVGWSATKKRKEMRLPDLRYLLVGPADGGGRTGGVEGFLSFMLTYEDGREVVYCYEIHLAPMLRGCGLGGHLMSMMEGIGMKIGVEKAMLTVFVANGGAVEFYGGLGYGEDEFSPRPRKLRNGVVKKADYVILSKELRTDG